MKYIVITLITIFGLYVGYNLYKEMTMKPATEAQLEDVRRELSGKIDSVQKQIEKLDMKVDRKTDSIIHICKKAEINVDSLKAGQVLIYYEVKKQNSGSFFERIRNYLN